MLTQIYEITSAREAAAVCALGVDHVGVLVGDGSFPREQPLPRAVAIAASVQRPARLCTLFLSSDISFIVCSVRALSPAIVHLGAAPELVSPEHVLELKEALSGTPVMRSVPVVGSESIDIARAYEGIVDYVLLDSYRANDKQIGALGVTHDWSISRRIVEEVRTPVILAGGLGADNVAEAIRSVRPAGVDSKTKTDKGGSHTKDLDKVKSFIVAARQAAAA
jgi:phosphoribosylanthranilate isomerase